MTTYAPFKLAAVRQSHALQLSTSYCSALSLAARMTALGLFRLCTKERVKHTNNPSSKRSMNVFQRGTTRQSNEKTVPWGSLSFLFSAIFPQLKTIFHLIPENVRVSCHVVYRCPAIMGNVKDKRKHASRHTLFMKTNRTVYSDPTAYVVLGSQIVSDCTARCVHVQRGLKV